jgi:hypothetical protein
MKLLGERTWYLPRFLARPLRVRHPVTGRARGPEPEPARA